MRSAILILIIFNSYTLSAQELFPHTEPASTMPKGVTGMRFFYQNFKELPSQRTRYWNALRFMYGATPKLTLMLTGSISNHHTRKFPANLRNYFINHHQVIYKPNPTLFEGINFYAKYRWLSIDGQQKHLRLAFYGEAAKSFVPHDEAEPLLMGDNSGFGGGIIGTQLYKRFAASVTCGYIHPFTYNDKAQEITFKSGDGWNYNVSFGYRLMPVRYSSYKNININLYVEFINKSYDAAYMTVNGSYYDFEIYKNFDQIIYNSLQANKYSEIRPSIQVIVNSNNRIDIGMAQPFFGKSYMHFYPIFYFSFQKYFFPTSRNKKISPSI